MRCYVLYQVTNIIQLILTWFKKIVIYQRDIFAQEWDDDFLLAGKNQSPYQAWVLRQTDCKFLQNHAHNTPRKYSIDIEGSHPPKYINTFNEIQPVEAKGI